MLVKRAIIAFAAAAATLALTLAPGIPVTIKETAKKPLPQNGAAQKEPPAEAGKKKSP